MSKDTIEKKSTVEQPLARPKDVLEGLIHLEITLAEDAGKPHRVKAGALLNEIKHHFKSNSDFDAYVKRTFDVQTATAHKWMKWAKAESEGVRHKKSPLTNKNFASWYSDVKHEVDDVDVEAMNAEIAARDAEDKLEAELALSLISIGYKALAVKLHPDKGGSDEAMRRLNKVRDALTAIYE